MERDSSLLRKPRSLSQHRLQTIVSLRIDLCIIRCTFRPIQGKMYGGGVSNRRARSLHEKRTAGLRWRKAGILCIKAAQSSTCTSRAMGVDRDEATHACGDECVRLMRFANQRGGTAASLITLQEWWQCRNDRSNHLWFVLDTADCSLDRSKLSSCRPSLRPSGDCSCIARRALREHGKSLCGSQA